jgi:hypothetical protein
LKLVSDSRDGGSDDGVILVCALVSMSFQPKKRSYGPVPCKRLTNTRRE